MKKYQFGCEIKKIKTEEFHIFSVGKVSLGAIKLNDGFKVYLNVCPHAGAPVCMGEVCFLAEGSTPFETSLDQNFRILKCPWHAYEFDLNTGKAIIPENKGLIPVAHKVVNGDLFVLI
jgi:3-phenylpropionate/trans-cinnamate dioxygenase ferredoxin subunit